MIAPHTHIRIQIPGACPSARSLDGPTRQAVHDLNGRAVSGHDVRIGPPCQFGTAEIGNWNPAGFPGNDPFLIRHFIGVMDEFQPVGRALTGAEIHALHADGKPQIPPPSQPVETRSSPPRSTRHPAGHET